MRPWPGNDQRALLAGYDRHGRNGGIDQLLQRCDFAMNAAALRDIDHRESRRVKDIAGHDHIGTAKEDDRIAIGVRGRLMEDFNTLAVEVHVFPRLVERFRWPAHPPDNGEGLPLGPLILVRTCSTESIDAPPPRKSAARPAPPFPRE